MKAIIHKPAHESYKQHRKQLFSQIILPVVISALFIVGLIVLVNIATFRDNGDVGRWAAISTIWIVIPVMVAGLIFFILLGGIVYLLKYLLDITPGYTRQVQEFIYLIFSYIERAADAAVKPVFFIDGLGASIERFLGRK